MHEGESDIANSMWSDAFHTSDFIGNEICSDRQADKRNISGKGNASIKYCKRRKISDVQNEYTCLGETQMAINGVLNEEPNALLFNVSEPSFGAKNDFGIEFLSLSTHKTDALEDIFFLSSDNIIYEKPIIEPFKSPSKHVKRVNSFGVLDKGKPFHSHWALGSKQELKNHSVPEPRFGNKTTLTKHLISFWRSVETGIKHTLPTIGSGASDSFMRISVDTVNNLFKENPHNLRFTIIDCRFEYEYEGGHIANACNINTTVQMDQFYKTEESQTVIFHCEYSSIRAPRLAHYLRNKDRTSNEYPKLKFPEIYIMEGGYKKFYECHNESCTPMHYVSMDEPKRKM